MDTPGFPVANHFGDGHHDKNDIKVYGVLACRGSEKIRKDADQRIIFRCGDEHQLHGLQKLASVTIPPVLPLFLCFTDVRSLPSFVSHQLIINFWFHRLHFFCYVPSSIASAFCTYILALFFSFYSLSPTRLIKLRAENLHPTFLQLYVITGFFL